MNTIIDKGNLINIRFDHHQCTILLNSMKEKKTYTALKKISLEIKPSTTEKNRHRMNY